MVNFKPKATNSIHDHDAGSWSYRHAHDGWMRPHTHMNPADPPVFTDTHDHHEEGTNYPALTNDPTVALIKSRVMNRPTTWRAGQAAFNFLHDLNPELAEQIRGTQLDPFHLDDRLPEFYAWLERQ
jgi:hypothetical protein